MPIQWIHSGMSSVEKKVALALADKEGMALKRQQAIAEEAEKKRRKREAMERAKMQPDVTPETKKLVPEEDEEKYAGPLLNGSAPEMIVSSGALGMTDTKRKVQVNYNSSRKRAAEDDQDDEVSYEDVEEAGTSSMTPRIPSKIRVVTQPHTVPTRSNKGLTVRDYVRGGLAGINTMAKMIPPTIAPPPTKPVRPKKFLTVKEYIQGGFKLTNETAPQLFNSHGPQMINCTPSTSNDYSTSNFGNSISIVGETSMPLDAMDESIFRVVKKAVSREYRIDETSHNQEYFEEDSDIDSFGETGNRFEVVSPERMMLDADRFHREKELLRYKEIGRRICELDLTDFAQSKSNNDRKGSMIANRGEEILASVRRNLLIIREKLGEYSEGTIFEHVDELTNSFSNVTPNALARLNQLVTEKREAATAATKNAESSTTSELLEVKSEEPEIKLEPSE